MSTALLCLILFGTDDHPSSLNNCSDGVLKSVRSIFRAARFCNLVRRSICDADAEPHVTEPLSMKGRI